ncbi:MAG: TonB C-terminal domain-containing protein [Chitinispirillaceae bacterium]|nr:TonB C-terminal domain-containing protein [Chitinispirillaceae bacterium]
MKKNANGKVIPHRRVHGVFLVAACLIAASFAQEKGETGSSKAAFASYVSNVQTVLQSNWSPDPADTNASVDLCFIIAKTGTLDSSYVCRSSGIPLIDSLALAALKKSAPFPPFPDSLAKERMPIKLTLRTKKEKLGYEQPFLE